MGALALDASHQTEVEELLDDRQLLEQQGSICSAKGVAKPRGRCLAAAFEVARTNDDAPWVERWTAERHAVGR